MPKYTDEDIRNMSKITCKIAADYLGISPMAVSIGMRNDLLPIGFAIHNEERDRTYSESWSYHIIGERLIAYKYGKTSEVRAIAILDTVFKSIESLGGSINSDLSVKIRDDIVRFRMVESQDQVKHEMTKQEAQELVKYNDDIKNHRWASKPQIRKYDKVYNGKLRIEFGERSYIRDNDSEKLEDRLGDILVTLYEKAEENRIVREAREEAERKRVEEARCREENRQRKEQEIRLVKELVNKAEDYRIAKEIREYIQAMIDSGNEDITPEWIEWALKKADWYDPSIETEDEYLGKRQHEKSAEEKEKSLQDSIRKSWYW